MVFLVGTVVAALHDTLDASQREDLADAISVEVFDPRTLYPFDWNGLAASLERTGEVVDKVSRIARSVPGIRATIDLAGLSPISLTASPNAGTGIGVVN